MKKGASVIIVNYGTPELLKNFLASIEKYLYDKNNIEVIIVDNGFPLKGDSRDAISLRDFSFKISFTQNYGSSYTSAINRGAQAAHYDILIIANSDIALSSELSFDTAINIFEQNEHIGIIGPQLIYPDHSWQRSYGYFPSLKELIISLAALDFFAHAASHLFMARKLLPKTAKSVDYVDGAFMIIRRNCFDECHGFDEDYLFYGEDADFCWRAKRLGWVTLFLPNIRIMHIRGASSTKKSFADYTSRQFQAKLLFVKEHFGLKHLQRYKYLLKAVAFQRYIFYSFISQAMPLKEFEARMESARLCYRVVSEMDLDEGNST